MKDICFFLRLGAVVALCTSSCGLYGQAMPPGQLTQRSNAALAKTNVALTVSAVGATGSNINTCQVTSSSSSATTASTTTTNAVKKDGTQTTTEQQQTTTAADSSTTYHYRWYFPIWSGKCTDDAILKFFSESNAISPANQVQYLYNSVQSTSQISADLITATFRPGFQVVLAGTATAGSSTPASGSAGAGQSTSATTDSAATAISKLEQGGDFNVRVPLPLFQHKGGDEGAGYGYDVKFLPNLGFTVNGLSGQNNITDQTEYSGNFPLDAYFQTASLQVAGQAQSVLYLDVKPMGEVISTKLATNLGLNSNRYFFALESSVGIEFSQSIRIGFQYFHGPSQFFSPTSGGSGAATGLSGIHFVVSFSPSALKGSKS